MADETRVDRPATDPSETPTLPGTIPPILTTIENLKRSVSSRALLLVTTTPSQRQALDDHRRLYRQLDELHLEYLAAHGISTRSVLPRWVMGGE